MARLRVLHAIGTSEVGGTERFLVDMVDRHRAAGIDSSICVLEAPGSLAEEYRRVAARVDHLNLPTNVLGAARRWRAIVRSVAPQVVVLYGARANGLGRLLHGGSRGPAVVSALRSTMVDDSGRRAAGWLDRITFRRVAACVSNSRSALETLLARGYPSDRLAYIPPGIDVDRFASADRLAARRALGVNGDEVVLLCVANLKPVKNHALLLRASAALVERGLTHRLWLVGEGPEHVHLAALARQLGIEDTVLFTGREADPLPRFAAADVFVLASKWEGAPTALMEAMAAGLPVVAPRVGDIPEIVFDGTTGRIIPSLDVESLTRAIAETLDEPRRTLWRDAARARAAVFGADIAAERYAELFRWAAAGGQEPMPSRYVERPQPVRILRVLSRLNVGGPSIHVVLLTRHMNDGRFATDLVVGAVGPGEGDMAYFAAERGVPIRWIPELGRSVNALRDVAALLKLTRTVFSFRPDVVHTHASKAGALGRASAILYNFVHTRPRQCVILHTYHGHTFEGYFRSLPAMVFRTVERALGRMTDGIIALSVAQEHDLTDRFRIVERERVRVVPLGLDLDPFFAVEDDDAARARAQLGLSMAEKVVVVAGRLTAVKNHAMLLRAFAMLARRVPGVRLVVVGDGELRETLRDEAAGLAIGDCVSFMGWRRDMASVYAAGDVVALTSVNEGTPVALIEGIAAGCRVVATRVGGVPDVIHPDCGILVESGDEDAFSHALETALRQGRLDRQARMTMTRFSIVRLVADLSAIYGELLAVHRSATAPQRNP